MVATLALQSDENGDMHDPGGHLCNAAGQRIDGQGIAILQPSSATEDKVPLQRLLADFTRPRKLHQCWGQKRLRRNYHPKLLGDHSNQTNQARPLRNYHAYTLSGRCVTTKSEPKLGRYEGTELESKLGRYEGTELESKLGPVLGSKTVTTKLTSKSPKKKNVENFFDKYFFEIDSSLRKALRKKRESSDKNPRRIVTQRPNTSSTRSLRSVQVRAKAQSLHSDRARAKARSLRSDRARAKARSLGSDRARAGARSLRSDRARTKVRSLRSDQALSRYVAIKRSVAT
ncbi:hypothetical protein DY000_02022053 [Brassica cretica]|uniref:Uncharacterized protein n=1 Tax=Brassica cretica TaxID=69181 RepID=A0ABQ7EC76_BRACR|nr:hypothetical protein DY000_02022053 [Brassica cretica]